MTTFEIVVPFLALGVAGVGIFLARLSAHRLERRRSDHAGAK